MEISKKMVGTVTDTWANTNIVWNSNPDLAEFLYKLIVQTEKEKVVVRILREDFENIEIGDTVEIVKKQEINLFTRCNFPYYTFARKIKWRVVELLLFSILPYLQVVHIIV